MRHSPRGALAAAALAAVALLPSLASARVNATNAMDVFMITDCAVCTKDSDSIMCFEGKGGDSANYVVARNNFSSDQFQNNDRVSLADKRKILFKQSDVASVGGRYCWEGACRGLGGNEGGCISGDVAAARETPPAPTPTTYSHLPPSAVSPPVGTFAKLLRPQVSGVDMLGSTNVTANLACEQRNLYYRQCVSEWRAGRRRWGQKHRL